MAKNNSNAVEINKLSEELAKELAGYSRAVGSEVKKAADEVAADLLKATRADAPKRSGKYKKSMAVKTRFENEYEKRNTWYVKSPEYRKAHLLEKGHKIATGTFIARRNGKTYRFTRSKGGSTRAYPHIEKNEEKAAAEFEKRVREAIAHAK